jgi:YHS domain-containing protein
MIKSTRFTLSAALLVGAGFLAGCGSKQSGQPGDASPAGAQQVCPVSGEKLGSMGEPFVFEYKGRQIKLCCDGCKDDFDKDPERYVSKLKQ